MNTATRQLGSAAEAATSAAAIAAPAALKAAGATAWVPIVGPAIAAVSLGIGLWMNRKGPTQKVASTNIVNEAEPHLAANVQAYLASARTRTNQAASLANFDRIWAHITSPQGCGTPDLGNPGKACIRDRDRGGRWDWFALYRDPIAQDPEVQDDPGPLSAEALGQPEGLHRSLLPLSLILLALAV
ncbi:MAG TPA: hypothetical protein DEH78_23445 [Solibacterales bacterium]|nr:hypothetical protein [Bryobacterales bacterium]